MRTGLLDTVIRGDCVQQMRWMPSGSVDFILTDPPYLCRYRCRDGRTVFNDDRDDWLAPAFREMYRVLKPGCFCVSFYGWNAADRFIGAWRTAGFRTVGHLVFVKSYASSSRFVRNRHEQAYVLAKGRPSVTPRPIDDVRDWRYTGNRLHPTQKPISVLAPLIESFCKPKGVVLDPFCGSGSTLVAAQAVGCRYVGIELDAGHHHTAGLRLNSALRRYHEETGCSP